MRTDSTLQSPPTLADLRARREEILALAERHKATNVRVFGSVARGEADPGSDVDFLVTYQKGASLYDVAGLFVDLQELLGVAVDVVEDHAGLSDRFRRRIVKDVVPL